MAQPVDGGVGNYVYRLAVEQTNQGQEVAVACPSHGQLPRRLRETGVECLAWDARRNPGISLIREVWSLHRIFATARPDVVHLHSSKSGLVGRLVPKAPPIVFQPHGWSWDALRPPSDGAAAAWERLAAHRAHAIVLVSHHERQAAERRGVQGNWVTIPSGIDLSAFPYADAERRRSEREKLGLADVPTAVCVGTLRPAAKGQDVLLRAWPQVAAAIRGAQLVLVGDGPERDKLVKAATGDVLFVGHQDDVGDWIAAADVAVLPSRRDAFSLALLEAMACGRSVVATDLPGVSELLEGAGEVVPVDDAGALAAAIARRLRDEPLAEREGRRGHERIHAGFDFRKVVAGITDLYKNAISSRRRLRDQKYP